MHASERPPSAPTKFDANVAAFRPTHGSESAKHLHLPTCAVASAFRKSGSCKCSDRARNCSPWYPSLCSRSFTFHQRYRYRYPPFSAASLIACWTLFMGQSYKCQLLWDRRSAGNGTSGHCQVSSRAGTRPELRLPNPVAQTRIVSVARIRLDLGNLRDLSKGYFATTFLSSSLTCPAKQSRLYQPTWANIAQTAWCRGVIYSPGDGCAEQRQGGEQNKATFVLFWRAFLPV